MNVPVCRGVCDNNTEIVVFSENSFGNFNTVGSHQCVSDKSVIDIYGCGKMHIPKVKFTCIAYLFFGKSETCFVNATARKRIADRICPIAECDRYSIFRMFKISKTVFVTDKLGFFA